ncbi:MAG TPA: hypothetical protein VGM33_22910 [Baekduia sp.]|jgi:hypothetical protein
MGWRASRAAIPALAAMAVALAVAACGGGGDDSSGPAPTTTPYGVAAPALQPPPLPKWIPARLKARVDYRGPKTSGCHVFYNGERHSYGVYVAGGARCQTGLLVLADFDHHLMPSDLTPRCGYRLCLPHGRTYRSYRCRLTRQSDGYYAFLCQRGARKIGFDYGG